MAEEEVLQTQEPPILGRVSGTEVLMPPEGFPRYRSKCAIVGFAPSSMRDVEFVWDDPDLEIWGLNQLYIVYPRLVPHVTRWFQIHHKHSYEAALGRDHSHHAWLAEQTAFPIYMQDRQPDIPMSIRFPKEELLSKFRRYFTNSISWEIALAIYEGFQTIYLFGVDMATDSEYAYERPSCEYFVGLAEGAGIKVVLPDKSDLLKAIYLYPFEDEAPFKAKLEARRQELRSRVGQAASAEQENHDMRIHMLGALENMNYIEKTWGTCRNEMIIPKQEQK